MALTTLRKDVPLICQGHWSYPHPWCKLISSHIFNHTQILTTSSSNTVIPAMPPCFFFAALIDCRMQVATRVDCHGCAVDGSFLACGAGLLVDGWLDGWLDKSTAEGCLSRPADSLPLQYFCINATIWLSLLACMVMHQVEELNNFQQQLAFTLASSRATIFVIFFLSASVPTRYSSNLLVSCVAMDFLNWVRSPACSCFFCSKYCISSSICTLSLWFSRHNLVTLPPIPIGVQVL